MLWAKWLHIVFMVAWFAGLFYLPRLFVYHSTSHDRISRDRFLLMERRLYFAIMTPAAILTVAFGLSLWVFYDFSGAWVYGKVLLTSLLAGYHGYCGKVIHDFSLERCRRSSRFFRWFNEFPTVILLVATYLAVFKPS